MSSEIGSPVAIESCRAKRSTLSTEDTDVKRENRGHGIQEKVERCLPFVPVLSVVEKL